jgi:hypothetical protein
VQRTATDSNDLPSLDLFAIVWQRHCSEAVDDLVVSIACDLIDAMNGIIAQSRDLPVATAETR